MDGELITNNPAALAPFTGAGLSEPGSGPLSRSGAGLPALPWRDPHNVPPEQRAALIQSLEKACVENPTSPDLRVCLAMAHAISHDAYKSLDALQAALDIQPNHFFAQLKLAELWYRLRALPKAEEEAKKALELAANQSEYQMARAQLQEVRKLLHTSWKRPTWDRPMLPGVMLLFGVIALLLVGWWLR